MLRLANIIGWARSTTETLRLETPSTGLLRWDKEKPSRQSEVPNTLAQVFLTTQAPFSSLIAMTISFRRVEQADWTATRSVVDEAFKSKGSRGTAEFLDCLRQDGCILGEWLAEDGFGTAGHIVFSRVWLRQEDGKRVAAAMLTPLAVRPDRQRKGTGLALMDFAMKELEENGESLFFVLGIPDYYPKAGFSAKLARNVASPWRQNPAFMVRTDKTPSGVLEIPSVIRDAH